MSDGILIPVAAGELLDKITILEIKAERISDPKRLHNIQTELDLLRGIEAKIAIDGMSLKEITGKLKTINAAIWDDEERLRVFGAANDLDHGFTDAAYRIYQNNDRRYAIKRHINAICGSAIIEEKSY